MGDVDPPPVPSKAPTTSQVWSAALQNVAAIICLTIGFLSGKIAVEWYLPMIALIVGVDFWGRKKLPGSLGSVAVFSNLWPHLCVGLTLAFASSCAESQFRPQTAIDAAKPAVAAVCELPGIAAECNKADALLASIGSHTGDTMVKVGGALDALKTGYAFACAQPAGVEEALCSRAREALNFAIKGYTDVNEALKASETEDE